MVFNWDIYTIPYLHTCTHYFHTMITIPYYMYIYIAWNIFNCVQTNHSNISQKLLLIGDVPQSGYQQVIVVLLKWSCFPGSIWRWQVIDEHPYFEALQVHQVSVQSVTYVWQRAHCLIECLYKEVGSSVPLAGDEGVHQQVLEHTAQTLADSLTSSWK